VKLVLVRVKVGLFLVAVFTTATIILLLFESGRDFIKKYYPGNVLFEEIFKDFHLLDTEDDIFEITMFVIVVASKIFMYLLVINLILFMGSYLIFIPMLVGIFIKFKLQKERDKTEKEDSFFN